MLKVDFKFKSYRLRNRTDHDTCNTEKETTAVTTPHRTTNCRRNLKENDPKKYNEIKKQDTERKKAQYVPIHKKSQKGIEVQRKMWRQQKRNAKKSGKNISKKPIKMLNEEEKREYMRKKEARKQKKTN